MFEESIASPGDVKNLKEKVLKRKEGKVRVREQRKGRKNRDLQGNGSRGRKLTFAVFTSRLLSGVLGELAVAGLAVAVLLDLLGGG